MMSEPRPDGKITLEDLLRIKRSERPPAEFWTSFERELRTRQLAAAVDKRRWWDGFSRAFTGLSRLQVPVGAAAVFAVTFLTLREYRESPSLPLMTPSATELADRLDESQSSEPAEVLEFAVIDVVPLARTSPTVASRAEVATTTPESAPRQGATQFQWSESADDSSLELSPSARSIAANLAAAEPELRRVLGSLSTLRVSEANQREPLAELTTPRDQRRQRLFGYDAELASYSDAGATVAPERVANRLDDSTLYETVRRLSGGGDRLIVKF